PELNAVSIDVLDRGGLACLFVQSKHRDVVLAARENVLAAELDRARRAVRDVSEPAIRMNMNGAGTLSDAGIGIAQRRQCALDEERLGRKRAVAIHLKDIDLVLA